MSDEDEMLDLVDQGDNVIGSISRGDSNNIDPESNHYIRCVSAFVMRSNGDIWTPIRSEQKRIAPGGFDYGCGGYVSKGETYDQTVTREAEEEASITPDQASFTQIAKNRLPGTPSFFEAVYLIRTDQQPTLSDEHSSGKWLGVVEAQTLIENGTLAKSSMPGNLNKLKSYLSSESYKSVTPTKEVQ